MSNCESAFFQNIVVLALFRKQSNLNKQNLAIKISSAKTQKHASQQQIF